MTSAHTRCLLGGVPVGMFHRFYSGKTKKKKKNMFQWQYNETSINRSCNKETTLLLKHRHHVTPQMFVRLRLCWTEHISFTLRMTLLCPRHLTCCSSDGCSPCGQGGWALSSAPQQASRGRTGQTYHASAQEIKQPSHATMQEIKQSSSSQIIHQHYAVWRQDAAKHAG